MMMWLGGDDAVDSAGCWPGCLQNLVNSWRHEPPGPARVLVDFDLEPERRPLERSQVLGVLEEVAHLDEAGSLERPLDRPWVWDQQVEIAENASLPRVEAGDLWSLDEDERALAQRSDTLEQRRREHNRHGSAPLLPREHRWDR